MLVTILFLPHFHDHFIKQFHPHFQNPHLQHEQGVFKLNWMSSGAGIKKVWGYCWLILPTCYQQLTFIRAFKPLVHKICSCSSVLVADFQLVLQAVIPEMNPYRESYFQKAQVILFVFRTLFQPLLHRASITSSKTTSFLTYTGKRTVQHFWQRYKASIGLTI